MKADPVAVDRRGLAGRTTRRASSSQLDKVVQNDREEHREAALKRVHDAIPVWESWIAGNADTIDDVKNVPASSNIRRDRAGQRHDTAQAPGSVLGHRRLCSRR